MPADISDAQGQPVTRAAMLAATAAAAAAAVLQQLQTVRARHNLAENQSITRVNGRARVVSQRAREQIRAPQSRSRLLNERGERCSPAASRDTSARDQAREMRARSSSGRICNEQINKFIQMLAHFVHTIIDSFSCACRVREKRSQRADYVRDEVFVVRVPYLVRFDRFSHFWHCALLRARASLSLRAHAARASCRGTDNGSAQINQILSKRLRARAKVTKLKTTKMSSARACFCGVLYLLLARMLRNRRRTNGSARAGLRLR